MRGHPVFARFYRVLEKVVGPAEAPFRDELLGDLSGPVLEIGAGTGANLEHYPEGVRPVLSEPDPYMLRTLREHAERSPLRPLLVRAAAEALPFRDGAFGAVVSSLVLCSVRHPGGAAGEIRRVLGPDGELRFYEHVRSREPGLARRQDRYAGPWGWFSAGCHPNRDTVRTLSGSGFGVGWRGWRMKGGWIAAPHVIGVARKTP